MTTRAIIQKSLDYIEENLQTEITATELAQQAGFSLFHYYRLFQQATGVPVMQYILRRRLLHGIYAIKLGSTKTDAALRFGFDTYAGFYKAFSREFGITPSDFLQCGRAKRPYRINITKEEHMTVTHKKAAQLLKHWGLENEPISDIYYEGTETKNESALYVGEHYVLKYTPELDKLEQHLAISGTAEEAGLSAPVLKTADGQTYIRDGALYFYVCRRLPGKSLAPGSFYEGSYGENARLVGELIGQLHLTLLASHHKGKETNLLQTVSDWALPAAKAHLGLSEAFCREYLGELTRLFDRLPQQIIHRDPNPSNIIADGSGWGFIDFELAERNVRIYDPCYAATAVLSESFGQHNEEWPEVYRGILCGYDSVAHLTEAERLAVPYVLLANQFVCVAWFAGQDQYAELFETNKQMTLWLISQFDRLKEL